jgi:DNA-binding NarL/FixJ family response regulator
MRVIAQCDSSDELLAMLASKPASVVIVDLNLPGVDAMEAVATITFRFPDVRVIVVTGFPDPTQVDRAFAAGAWGVVLRSHSGIELVRAVRAVGNGEFVLPEFPPQPAE